MIAPSPAWFLTIAALSPAHAASGEVSLGGDLLPDSLGQTRNRGSLGLSFGETWGAWQVDLSGTIRSASEVDPVGVDIVGAVERMELAGAWGQTNLVLGRVVRMDLRGNERIDGVHVGTESGGWSTNLWGGRLWFPESLLPGPGYSQITGTSGEDAGVSSGDHTATTWVGGGEARLRLAKPVLDARVSAGLGAELRVTDGSLGGRLHIGADAKGARGGGLRGVAEVDPTANRWRAQAHAGAPVTRLVDLGATWRWEDLPAATIPDAAQPPSSWLSDAGYGVATAEVRLREAGHSVVLAAGPVIGVGTDPDKLDPDGSGSGGSGPDGLGALGRLDAAAHVGDTTGHLFGTGAWTGENGYVGGGVGAEQSVGRVQAGVEGGLYRVRHLDDRDTWAGEARLHGGGVLIRQGRSGVSLEAELAAGADRLLSPWVRGGLLLTGTLDARTHGGADPGPTPPGAS